MTETKPSAGAMEAAQEIMTEVLKADFYPPVECAARIIDLHTQPDQEEIANRVDPCPDCTGRNLDCPTCKGWGQLWKVNRDRADVRELVKAAREAGIQLAYYRKEIVDGNGVHADLGNATPARLQSALEPFKEGEE